MNRKSMQQIGILAVGMLLLALPAMAATPDGDTGPWADDWVGDPVGPVSEGGTQGPEVSGTGADVCADSPVSDRSDPNNALGPAEGTIFDSEGDPVFYSLGFGGELVLEFENCAANGEGADLNIVESTTLDDVVAPTTPAEYPEEADVWVSQDGTNWVKATTSGPILQSGEVSIPASLSWIKFVRIEDVSDPTDPGFTESGYCNDGFDVDGVEALHSSETCDACEPHTTSLIVGQHNDGGVVQVSNDDTNLYVQVTTNGQQGSIEELHVYAGTESPPNAPGQFPYKASFDPAVDSHTMIISLSDLGLTEECGETLNVAVHTTMSNGQSGWADGPNELRGWATYFTYEVCCGVAPSSASCRAAEPIETEKGMKLQLRREWNHDPV